MNRLRLLTAVLTGTVAMPLWAQVAPVPVPASVADAQASPDSGAVAATGVADDPANGDVIVTARRRAENLQDVPIAITAITGRTLENTGAYGIAAVAQQAPTLQFLSSNPRNTALNIRGLGVSYGLANDGLEQGVGLYVDGVYNSRPAAATFDLLDIDRFEVLRGPQGTLFGKNTTAGALNITTRAPSFTPGAQFEGSVGNYGFVQAKGSITGPLIGDAVAGRFSITKTHRNGLIRNVTTGDRVNEQDNLTLRGQLLWQASPALSFRLIGDYSYQDPDCCTQVYVSNGATLRPANRQYPALAAGLGYAPPSLNPYDRLADVNSPIQAIQELGGVSLTGDLDLGGAALTSISAWRFWNWKPRNDRDYTSLSILTESANPVQQDQYSQEIRLSSTGKRAIDYTVGGYYFHQTLDGQNRTAYGRDATYWLLDAALPSSLLDGYVSQAEATSHIDSYAAFAQGTWNVTDRLHVTPGLRYTIEKKDAVVDQTVSGGLANPTAAQLTRRLSIARPQSYSADFTEKKLTGQGSIAYDVTDDIHSYVSYARGFKSGGINLAGLPFNAANLPALDRAAVSPEKATTYEFGLKTRLFDRRLTANFAIFRNDIRDFQANVVDTGPGALRGYLANIDKVRSQGAEADLTLAPIGGVSSYVRVAYTDAQYRSFPNAPCPLELIGNSTTQCNLSGRDLPGVSKWALSGGGEYRRPLNNGAEAYFGVEGNYRSAFFADASDSVYARVPGYAVFNLRAGYRAAETWEVFAFVRNAFDANYLQFVQVQSGNSGLISGLPGDQRTFGLTGRLRFGG